MHFHLWMFGVSSFKCNKYCLSVICQVSLLKINATGEYAPLKFSFEYYTCDGDTDRSTGERLHSWVYLLVSVALYLH